MNDHDIHGLLHVLYQVWYIGHHAVCGLLDVLHEVLRCIRDMIIQNVSIVLDTKINKPSSMLFDTVCTSKVYIQTFADNYVKIHYHLIAGSLKSQG